jgi:hypothetical protein
VTEMEQPRRESPQAHQCVCLLVKGPTVVTLGAEVTIETTTGFRNKCFAMVSNPDQPFCDYCEEQGHDLFTDQMGTVRP